MPESCEDVVKTEGKMCERCYWPLWCCEFGRTKTWGSKMCRSFSALFCSSTNQVWHLTTRIPLQWLTPLLITVTHPVFHDKQRIRFNFAIYPYSAYFWYIKFLFLFRFCFDIHFWFVLCSSDSSQELEILWDTARIALPAQNSQTRSQTQLPSL